MTLFSCSGWSPGKAEVGCGMCKTAAKWVWREGRLTLLCHKALMYGQEAENENESEENSHGNCITF